jgi:hypothetical protein
MNAPKSSDAKKSSRNNSKNPESWISRIDYLALIKKTAGIFWNSKKRLIGLAILLLLTGGQTVTFNSSFSSNFNGGGSGNFDQNSSKEENSSWQDSLKKIESQENFKGEIRSLLENKAQLYSVIALGILAALIFILFFIAVFCWNCSLHLQLINTIKYLEAGRAKSKPAIKRKVRGRWKKLFWLRVIFGLFYLGSLALFMFPALFFILQKSWAMAIAMGGFSLLAIFIVFMMISYVFRYSLYYLATGNLSIKESIDCGYEVFSKFWKESVLTSVINLLISIAAMFAAMFFLFLCLIGLALVAAIVGLIIYLVAGMAHATGIAIGVGIVLVGIPMVIIAIILAASWQALVVIFWYLIFQQIAGCKVPEPEKAPALAKAKKPAVKPVIQKEE